MDNRLISTKKKFEHKELSDVEIQQFAKEYFSSTKCALYWRSTKETEEIISPFIDLIINGNNPYLKLLCKNLWSLRILCDVWEANFEYLNLKYLIELTQDNSKENNYLFASKILERMLIEAGCQFLKSKGTPPTAIDTYIVVNDCKMNFAFLEYLAFVLMERPEEAEFSQLKQYFDDSAPNEKDILEFGFVENISDSEFKPRFINDTFQSYFCARYIISCYLKNQKIENCNLYSFVFKHEINSTFPYADIHQFIEKKSTDIKYQLTWKFIEGIFSIYFSDLFESFNSNKNKIFNNIFVMLDSLSQNNYEWMLERKSDNELKITYTKSTDKFRYSIEKFIKIETLIKDWLVEEQLSDINLIIDDDQPIISICSQNKESIDKIVSWLDEIERLYAHSKQLRFNTQNKHSFFINTLQVLPSKDAQLKDDKKSEVKVECRIF